MTRAIRVVELLIGIGLVVALVVGLGTGAVLDGIRAVSVPAMAVALAIGVVTTSASAGRWCLVAGGLGLPLGFRAALAACYRAQFLNSVLPVGVLGDVHRAVDHGRRADAVVRGAGAVVLERAAGQVVTVAVALAVLLVAPGPWRALVSGPATLLAGAAVVVALVLAVGLGVLRSTRSGQAVRRWVAATGDGVADGLLTVRTAPGVVALSVIATLGHLALLATAVAEVGVGVPVGSLLPVLALALLAMGLPITVAGWGPREATMAVGFSAVGLPAASGLAASVAYGVLALVSCAPGAVVLALGHVGARRGSGDPAPSSGTGSPSRGGAD